MGKLSTAFVMFLILGVSFAKEKQLTIVGNSKTKESYIRDLTKRCLKDIDFKINTKKIEQCLFNARIFSKVQVLDEKEKGLRIIVEDRWSIIPLPRFQSGEGDSSYGMMVIETNLLGYGKLGVLGGSFGSAGQSYFFLYKDPSIMFSDWTTKVMISKFNMDEAAYDGDDKIFATKHKGDEMFWVFGRKITEKLMISGGVKYCNSEYSAIEQYSKLTNVRSVSIKESIEYNNTKYKLYFDEGYFYKIDTSQQVKRSDDGDKSNEIASIVGYQKNIILDHAFQTKFTLFYKDKVDHRGSLKIGGSKGVRGIRDAGLWVKRAATIALDYQIPVYKKEYGTWTISPFLDLGTYSSQLKLCSDEFYNSYGIAGYLYLNNVTVPGLGIQVGRNRKFSDWFFGISVGISG